MADLPRQPVYLLAGIVITLPQGFFQTAFRLPQGLQRFGTVRADEFSRACGCRRAHVGGEIGQREIGFVPHAADDGNAAGGYCARNRLFVERP